MRLLGRGLLDRAGLGGAVGAGRLGNEGFSSEDSASCWGTEIFHTCKLQKITSVHESQIPPTDHNRGGASCADPHSTGVGYGGVSCHILSFQPLVLLHICSSSSPAPLLQAVTVLIKEEEHGMEKQMFMLP